MIQVQFENTPDVIQINLNAHILEVVKTTARYLIK